LTNGPIVIVLGNNPDRALAFYFVMVYVFQVYLVGYLQLLLHRPAPFWVTSDVSIFDCKPGYASPASATEISLTVVLTLWATFALAPGTTCKVWVKILTALLGLAVVTLSTFGHMYNGDASID